MRKTTTFLLLLALYIILCISRSNAQQVVYDWKHTIQGYNYTAMACMATDSSGNVYVGGTIDSLVNFPDTSLNTTEPTGYLAKFDTYGDLIWFRLFPHSTVVLSICFDSEDNLYISGEFNGKVEINDTVFPSFDSDTNFSGMFLAKFNTNADLIWAKTTGGMFYYSTGFGKLKQMTVDHNDNIIVVGYGIGELEYFDTTAVYTRQHDSAWVTTPFPHWVYYYNYTNYLAKFDKNGEKLWIKDLGDYSQEYYSIAADFSNNILLCGKFAEGVGNDFIIDTIVLTSGVGRNIFIAKYNSAGQVLFAQKAGVIQYYTNKGYDVCVGEDNSIYMSGCIGGGSLLFGDTVFSTSGGAFLTKYDSAGHVTWVKVIGSGYLEDGSNENYGVTVKYLNENVYLCGFFLDSLLFNNINLISIETWAGMILRFNSNGVLLGALMDSIYNQWIKPNEIAFCSDSCLFISGHIASWEGEWNWNMYFGKFSNYFLSNIQVANIPLQFDYISYPNPCTNFLQLNFNEFASRRILLLSIHGVVNQEIWSNETVVKLDFSSLPAGIYFIRVQNGEQIVTKKVIKM